MKKSFLTLLGLVAISTTAVAQQEVKFGPKAGVNFANINGKLIMDGDGIYEFDEGTTGFHVGAFAEIMFTEKFAIQPEILYSTQGGKLESSTGGTISGFSYTEKDEMNWSLHYINVPIMAKYYVIPSVAIEAGTYIGFNIKSENEYDYSYTSSEGSDSYNATFDFKDGTNSVDFGLGFGASYNLNNGFFASARYSLGLSKVGEESTIKIDNEDVKMNADDMKNGNFQISVGYKF